MSSRVNKESRSYRVKESESPGVRESRSQRVNESGSQRVRESKSLAVNIASILYWFIELKFILSVTFFYLLCNVFY